mmetsp:Transcript_3540/g.7996  ORF Transcript_3540/g.7996 Transcript_3540/m.7996 type:complete len:223 (+) Transcript_3540:788-1456(+)
MGPSLRLLRRFGLPSAAVGHLDHYRLFARPHGRLLLQVRAARHAADVGFGHGLRHLPRVLSARVPSGRAVQPARPLWRERLGTCCRPRHCRSVHGFHCVQCGWLEASGDGQGARHRFGQAARRHDEPQRRQRRGRGGRGVLVVLPLDDGCVLTLHGDAAHRLDHAASFRERRPSDRHQWRLVRGSGLFLGEALLAMGGACALWLDSPRALLLARVARLRHRV